MQAMPAAGLPTVLYVQCPGAAPAASHADWPLPTSAMQVLNEVVVAHRSVLKWQPSWASQLAWEMPGSAHALLYVGTQVLPAATSPMHIGLISPPPCSQIAQSLEDEVPAVHVAAACSQFKRSAVNDSHRCGARPRVEAKLTGVSDGVPVQLI